ncbi:MAG TPA: HAD hydrolase-like protein [Pseudonocardiaceae bacterium]
MNIAAELLADREHVLFDFDGSVCALFGGTSDGVVASRLRVFLGADLPAEIAATDDPFDVLRYARTCSTTTRQLVERELRHQELAAIDTATETPGIRDVLQSLTITGHILTIVTNNAADAVGAYLGRHEFGRHVAEVSGRHSEEWTPLKPDPFLVRQAMWFLDTTPDRCCMIGDSVTDIQAGHALGVPVIAYAHEPEMRSLFAPHKPDAVIDHMTELMSFPGA